MRKSNIEEFVRKARLIHGDLYNYSKFEYTKASEKSIIVCKIHGDFLQRPNNHLNGSGCKLCTLSFTPTLEGFVQKASEIHNGKYDYSKSKFIKSTSKILIICPIHGEFYQQANAHVWGKGCYDCGGRKQQNTQDFVLRASLLHKNLYDYSKVDYSNCDAKVEIICPIHGPFFQRAMSHLRGAGCRKCLFDKLSNITISQAQIEFLEHLKITTVNFRIGKYIVDGIQDNVVFEFLGDYWHSNPSKFDHNTIHPHYKVTHRQVYENTFDRLNEIHNMGYDIKYIWESDWNQFRKDQLELNIRDLRIA